MVDRRCPADRSRNLAPPAKGPVMARDPDTAGFDALYRTHAPMVRRALRQLGLRGAAVEDGTQDVFVVLARRLRDYDGRASLTSWLWGIARRVAADHRRSRRRHARLCAALPGGISAPPMSGPEGAVVQRRALATLDRFLTGLDADKCAVFVLAEIEGRTGREIADRLGVNENTVHARLRAARQRMRRCVDADRNRGGTRFLGIVWAPRLWAPVLGGALVAPVVMGGPLGAPMDAPARVAWDPGETVVAPPGPSVRIPAAMGPPSPPPPPEEPSPPTPPARARVASPPPPPPPPAAPDPAPISADPPPTEPLQPDGLWIHGTATPGTISPLLRAPIDFTGRLVELH